MNLIVDNAFLVIDIIIKNNVFSVPGQNSSSIEFNVVNLSSKDKYYLEIFLEHRIRISLHYI